MYELAQPDSVMKKLGIHPFQLLVDHEVASWLELSALFAFLNGPHQGKPDPQHPYCTEFVACETQVCTTRVCTAS